MTKSIRVLWLTVELRAAEAALTPATSPQRWNREQMTAEARRELVAARRAQAEIEPTLFDGGGK